jgi:flagellar basal-body rod modification protein FlgD
MQIGSAIASALAPTVANALTASTTKGSGKELDKEAFLKLLMTQLKNQDPMNTMDQKDMMTQLTQLTSMEQMTNITKSLTTMANFTMLSQSAGLIGKTVSYKDPQSGEIISGKAASVTMTKGTPYIKVDGRSIKLDEILSIE